MRDAFLKQLEELHKMLAEMGNLCESMIDGAYEALMNMDREQAAKILAADANVDLKERDIESKCLKLLLEQQPVASDLRTISSTLKMITDLERIGDQAGDIAEIVKTTDLSAPVKATRLGEMAKAVASMVRESIESFANGDLKKTKEVIEYDDVIDNLFNEVKKELADGILNGEATQEQILDVLMIAKYLERIGDHATNIAEWAEYAITGVHRNSEMEEHLSTGKKVNRAKFTAAFADAFGGYYRRYMQDGDVSAFVEEYDELLANKDKEVIIYHGMVEDATPDKISRGIARGIDKDGSLLVEIDGSVTPVMSGEVSIRGVQGYV